MAMWALGKDNRVEQHGLLPEYIETILNHAVQWTYLLRAEIMCLINDIIA